jgi:hypothetical protein
MRGGRPTQLALLSVTLFLFLLPLALGRPGWPPALKADEPAYFLMSLSLARDGDLRCEPRDLARLFHEFPYAPVRNLIVMSDDGWRTVYFGKPFLYSLLAAPFARLFGAHGMVAFNMLLLLAMVWMATRYLARRNPEGRAALFAAGFFLLSPAFVYAFWLHPEVLMMAAVTTSLFLAWNRGPEETSPLLGLASGVALAAAAYHKPILALLGLAPLAGWLKLRRLRPAAAWCLGFVAASLVLAGLALLWTGHPTAYLGIERAGVTVESPERLPLVPVPATVEPEDAPANSWAWIFRVPELRPRQLAEDVWYFLVGRHVGLVPYYPLAALSLLFFLLFSRRERGWWLLLSLGGVALFYFLWIPFNWWGGGGFVGNRYFAVACPAFLFLVERLGPGWTLASGWAAGGLMLGPLLFTPFGAPVPQPTLQSHTRGFPFRLFPLELSLLGKVPGYQGQVVGGSWFVGRKDQYRPHGSTLWVVGGTDAELWWATSEPLGEEVLRVTTPALPNRVEVTLADLHREVVFGPAGSPRRQLELPPPEPSAVRWRDGGRVYFYRLQVHTKQGEEVPVDPQDSEAGHYFLGADLAFMGPPANLRADVYRVRWERCSIPPRMAAGTEARISARLRNESQVAWPARGLPAVHLAYHWRDAGGGVVEWEGERWRLPRSVAPGESATVTGSVRAPERPGRYLLELDLVYERVSWFSGRGADTCRGEVRVRRGGGGRAAAAGGRVGR